MVNRSVRKAFTLVEILIVVVILGILAAIVIPQFTKASEDAQVGNVETQLQTIRSQVELYRVRNNGNYPALPDASDTVNGGWGALVAPDFLRSAPVNPRTGTTTVVAGTRAGAAGTEATTGDDGWIFDGTNVYCNGFVEDFRSQTPVAAPWFKAGTP